MHSFFESDLSFLLFLPTFAIIGALYCAFPRQPRPALRWLVDIAVVIAAAALVFVLAWLLPRTRHRGWSVASSSTTASSSSCRTTGACIRTS